MTQSFTPESLIAYLYHETGAGETLAIDEALHENPLLAVEYDQLARAVQELPRVKFNAPRRSLQQIVRYSQRTALERFV